MGEPQPICLLTFNCYRNKGAKMKIFVIAALLSLTQALPQKVTFEQENVKGDIDVDTRAPSDYANCNCQCDSYTWVNSRGVRAGNCQVADNTEPSFAMFLEVPCVLAET